MQIHRRLYFIKARVFLKILFLSPEVAFQVLCFWDFALELCEMNIHTLFIV